MFTASDARKLQNAPEIHHTKGQLIDFIKSSIKQDRNCTQVSLEGWNLSAQTKKELDDVGFLINNNILSWKEEVPVNQD